MPADGTQIKQDIDNNLGNKGYRGIRIANIIPALKNLVDWVTTSINNNLTTWRKTSDDTPGGANADAVYRTGNTEYRGGVVAKAQTPANSTMATLPFGSQYPLQIQGLNGGPAVIEFHLPGFLIQQLGIDTDGVLKYHAWGTSKAYPLVVDTLTSRIKLAQTTGRKLVLYEVNDNENQYYGLGVDVAGFLTYMVAEPANDHVFYAATSAATRKELVRIKGNGNVGVGNATPAYQLDVAAVNPAGGIVASFKNSSNGGAAGATGAYVQLFQDGIAIWKLGLVPGLSALAIHSFGGGNQPEIARFTEDGRLLIGTTVSKATDLLRVAGPISGKFATMSANPSATDIEAGYERLIKNTSNGELRLWANDGGTMKSVLLS